MSNPSWIGKSLNNRYQIEEIIGQGGMSAVYKATDPNLGRVVAVKLIHPHLSDNPDFIRRFEEEAKAVAQLRHPNIIQVYDFDHAAEVYYIVLEFVAGETLQARLNRLRNSGRHMPIKEVKQYAINLCEAADYAHQRNMIHRDIKPANLMLSVSGEAILMDFGIAKILGGTQHTATGAVIGTARYMSPEQIKGERIDERSDIYSIGVTLFEMLSGRPPFDADSAMTLMMMHLHDPLPDLRNMRPNVPMDLIAVVEKALAKTPGERFSSAAAMAAAIRKVEDGATDAQATSPTSLEKQVDPLAVVTDETQTDSSSAVAAATPASGPDRVSLEDATMTASPEPAPVVQQPEPAQSQPKPVTASPPVVKAPSSSAGSPLKNLVQNKLVLGGIGLAIIVILVITFAVVIPGLGGDRPSAADTASQSATAAASTQLALAAAITPTFTVTASPSPTTIPNTPTSTLPPTKTPTQTLTPTATIPPGIEYYVRINQITINENNQYVVEYETFGYTEQLPGMHVHFFFDTVTPENAGSPGSGPWKLWGGPRPFKEYTVNNRPAGATQMCALVANPNHSIQLNSGNCMDLPAQ